MSPSGAPTSPADLRLKGEPFSSQTAGLLDEASRTTMYGNGKSLLGGSGTARSRRLRHPFEIQMLASRTTCWMRWQVQAWGVGSSPDGCQFTKGWADE